MHQRNKTRVPGCSAKRIGRSCQRGMTLIELMVAMLLGLVTTYFISQVFAVAEGHKRTATFGTDAQVNGAVALHTLRRHVMSAGYGIVSAPSLIGCPITGKFGVSGAGASPPVTALVPVLITPGTSASAPSDSIRVLTSTKASFAAPVVVKEAHDAADGKSFFVPVDGSTHGLKNDDVILAAPKEWNTTTDKCLLFTVKEDTTDPNTTLGRERIPHVPSASASSWNAAAAADWPASGFPSQSKIVNFGKPRRMDFAVSGDTLEVTTWTLEGAANPEQLNAGIVLLKALYGRDTDGNGTVDVYDTTSPTNNTEWRNVLALRLVVVARSGNRERDVVTTADPKWSAGSGAAISYDAYPGATTTCAANAATCELPLPIAHLSDWQHYRYRVFDTAVQVRNLMWSAEE